jgi:hypothetical protein
MEELTPLELPFVTKRETQKAKILGMLQKAGALGCTSEELNRVAFRYASVIFRLRRLGHEIETVERNGTELARFILRRGV